MAGTRTTHGLTDTAIHDTWINMKQRCHNERNPRHKDYGGRGIKVCDEWRNNFEAFYEHMGDIPGEGYTIERIDNDKDYEPGNCRWALRAEQNKNKRKSVFPNSRRIAINGEMLTVLDFAAKYKLSPATVYKRLDAGKSGNDLIARPDQRFATSSVLLKHTQR